MKTTNTITTSTSTSTSRSTARSLTQPTQHTRTLSTRLPNKVTEDPEPPRPPRPRPRTHTSQDGGQNAGEDEEQEGRDSALLMKWEREIKSFDEIGLHPDLLRGTYSYGFERPSVIQSVGLNSISLEIAPSSPSPPYYVRVRVLRNVIVFHR